MLLLLPQFAENPANNLIYFLYTSLTRFTDFTFRYSSDFHVLCVVRGDLHFNEHMFASDLTIIQRTYVRFTPSTRFLYPPYSIAIHCVQLNCVFFVFLLPYSLQNEFVSVSMYASVCVCMCATFHLYWTSENLCEVFPFSVVVVFEKDGIQDVNVTRRVVSEYLMLC